MTPPSGGGGNRILLVDDEQAIRKFLRIALEAHGFETVEAARGGEAVGKAALEQPALVILDLGLPDLDGKAALQKARAFYDGPILILSARDRETEKIDALDLGADDYVEKPFGVGELLARLRVALRHRIQRQGAAATVTAGDLTIDLVRRLVTRAGEPVRLTPKEYDLLAQLVQGAGRVVTHRQLLTAVWGPAHGEDVQYLRVVVGQLRQKIEAEPSEPRLIQTEAGVGYRWTG